MRSVILVLMALALGGFLYPVHTVWAQAPAVSGNIITIAGNGTLGFAGDGGQATGASFSGPLGMAVGPDGTLYIADSNNYRIRAIDPSSGIISTVAGNGPPPGGFLDDGPNGDGGPATDAQIGAVLYVDLDRQRNALYIPSPEIFRVRKVDLATGIIENFAGKGLFDNDIGFQDGDNGPATQAYLYNLLGLAVGAGNDVLITDGLNHRLRSIDGATGVISRIAGLEDSNGNPYTATGGDGGPAAQATFLRAWDVAADRAGNIFVMDVQGTSADSYIVRRIDAVTGIIDTIAGGGTMTTGSGAATEMFLATGGSAGALAYGALPMTVDDAGQTLYLTRGDNEVVAVDLATGQLTPFAGTSVQGFAGDGGPASNALFDRIGGLTAVPGGGLLVADSFNQRVRYIAPDSINLVGDAGQSEFHLPWVSALTGNVIISGNPNLMTFSTGSLESVTGVIHISDNPNLATISTGGLNGTGAVTIEGNTGASVIDLSGITSVTGNVTITDNGNATVSTGSLNVTGNIMLESTGTGTFSTGSADVTGNIDLNLDGYATVATSTGGGETGVIMINNEATMEVTLPDGAFTSATPVAFSITNQPGSVETVDGNTVTHLGTYNFEFAIPTLNSAAELNFEIELAAMTTPDRQSLLDLLHDDAVLTLGVRGDAPGAELQLFDVCASGGPVADSCVVAQWLDENRMLLDPLGSIDPAILRLEGLVGHFSTYSFVAVTLPGDYNVDGTVDAADYVTWRKFDGTQEGYDTWRANFGAVSLAIGAGSGSSSSTTVPEPASALLLMLAVAIGAFFGRRIASPVLSIR